jgi:hypothetical protein
MVPGDASRRAHALRAVKQFAWLEVGSGKVALSRPAPPDRACRDHQRVMHPVETVE